ncbi:M23 family metallopeptidase, partial [Nostoc sp. NIES-2111]
MSDTPACANVAIPEWVAAAAFMTPMASAAPLPEGGAAFAPIVLEQIPALPAKPRVVKETGPFQPILRGTQAGPTQDRTSALDTPPADHPRDRLAGLAQRLAAIETSQQAALAILERSAKAKAERVESALAEAGLAASRFRSLPKASLPAAQGGPLAPTAIDPAAGPFEAQLARTQQALVQADRLGRILDVVPRRRPLSGEAELSSGFGTRLDPFTRGIAMHTGLDFRGDTGDPVRVTAPGRVVTAEWSGGYGNMVEVDHGNGLTTRYGHLSAILVSPGDWVDTGATVGRLGSTGRSTGPHLHYETRIDGDPVDPLRFLRAGEGLNGCCNWGGPRRFPCHPRRPAQQAGKGIQGP